MGGLPKKLFFNVSRERMNIIPCSPVIIYNISLVLSLNQDILVLFRTSAYQERSLEKHVNIIYSTSIGKE